MHSKKIENVSISLCETCHESNGKPIYNKRFEKVLSFHNNIAPVYEKIDGKIVAYFINPEGENIFNKVFDYAYGFYDGLAAVKDKSGCYHINTCGEEAYSRRFSWCGNFCEKYSAVRDFELNYYHIDNKGNAIYPEKYKYVGDFKYSIAVVTLNNGNQTHILSTGKRLHNNEFLELEPYHKGLAVARDDGGYFHVNKKGVAVYSMRFKKIEPFYNDIAYGIDFYNNKILLDYNQLDLSFEDPYLGHSVSFLVKNSVEENYKATIAKDAFAFFDERILFSALKLGVLDAIDQKNLSDLEITDYLLKDILAWLCVNDYALLVDSSYELTLKGKYTLDLKNVIFYWQELPFDTSRFLHVSIKENQEYFSKIYGENFFSYISKDEDLKSYFQFISNFYSKDYMGLDYDFKSGDVICDIGCGSGNLLRMLKEKYPFIKTIDADIQDFRADKTSDFVEINFFKALPEVLKLANLFILSRILHDYNDEACILILKNIRAMLRENGKILILESLKNENIGLSVSFHILNLLGGRERTLEDFQRIFEKADLKINKIKKVTEVITLLEVSLLEASKKEII